MFHSSVSTVGQIMLLNTTSCKPQEGRAPLYTGLVCGLPVGHWLATVKTGSWTTWAFGLSQQACPIVLQREKTLAWMSI